MDIKVPPSNEEVEELHYSSLVRDPNPGKDQKALSWQDQMAALLRERAKDMHFKAHVLIWEKVKDQADGILMAAHFIETGEWE